MIKNQAVFSKDLTNRKLTVVRDFNASLDQIWKAWTQSEILDKWWAPKPYRAETKSMNFKEGGFWLYCMVGPQGDRTWCKVAYQKIELYKKIVSSAAFCDEQGHENMDFPKMDWKQDFSQSDSNTTVKIEITFAKEADMETIIKMGFQEGFTAGLNNLDDYLDNTLG